MENKKPTYQFIQHDMSPESRARLIELAKLGALWVAGKTSLEDVERRFGQSKLIGPPDDDEKTYSFSNLDYGVHFNWNLKLENAKEHRSRTFEIRLEANVRVNIDRDNLKDALGLNRTKVGELIDGVRKETLDYYAYVPLPGRDPDLVHLNYRFPLPDNSEFDVYAGFDYKRLPEQVGSTVENTDNFRELKISRWYLTSTELKQRDDAKRQKYGDMNLCTGMPCPETGYWEAWGHGGPLDVELLKTGQMFPTARTSSQTLRASRNYAVDARYFWLCSEHQKEMAFERMAPLRRLQNG
ncbi:hypothetical protein QCE73_33055 [Caballeronia sp. LZ029]|uniref:hypothetical protein n=1 Tax=Caballeronia sp. LZ029 TaxID=3038564 RepID=UPI00285F3B26|nr:hypothetical protein [Caballeronia sp. LZ029]MDR5748022.1 hypothetical protein [Caballeronia sp. LZ029]